MSTKGETLYHPVNGFAEQTWDGFSWPGFSFGNFWLATKQLWVQFIIATLIVIVTSGFGAIPIWIFYGFMGNSMHKQSLFRRGYLTEQQASNRGALPMAATATPKSDTRPKCSTCGEFSLPGSTKCEHCGRPLVSLKSSETDTAKPETVQRPTGSTIEELERLAALKDRGVLSEEEFQLQKRKILG